MARTKSNIVDSGVVVTDADTPGLPAIVDAANQFARIEANYSEERDLVNQLMGQTQALQAVSKWTTVVYLSKLQHIRENKLYRALPPKNVLDDNGQEIADCRLNTWDGFCQSLGLSANKVEEDLLNLRAFGEDALGSMQRIGIGYRELRQYRKLSDDQKTALIEVAKSGDKESFLDLAEEIMARSAKKDALVVELQANYDAQSAVLKNKNNTIDEQHTAIHKLKRRVETAAPDEVANDLRKEAGEHSYSAEAAILGSLRPAFAALTEHGINHDLSHEEFMVGLLAQIERAVATVRSQFGLKALADGNPMPDWARDDSDEKVAANLAKLDMPDFLK